MFTKKDLLPKNKPFGNSTATMKTTSPKDPLAKNGPPFMKSVDPKEIMAGMKRKLKK